MTTIKVFFPHKLGHFFPIFEKGEGTPPPLPPLVTRLHTWMYSTSEYIQDLANKSKISKTISATGDNWMSVFNFWKNVRSEQTLI